MRSSRKKDDEMGRLMVAFEKMRIRLRDNAEEKLKSDRESKRTDQQYFP